MTLAPRPIDFAPAPPPPAAALVDPLADALEHVGVWSWILGRLDLSAPWGLRVDTRLGWLYLVRRGGCLSAVADAPPRPLAPGDLLVVFQQHVHELRDGPLSPVVPLQALLAPRHFQHRSPVVHGGGGAAAQLFCGCFLLDGLETSPLAAALPASIVVAGAAPAGAASATQIAQLLESETGAAAVDQSVVNHLVRILLLKALRAHVGDLPAERANWLRAVADPDIGRALSRMHAQPDARWTVAALAECAALSRSTFAERFTRLVGKPPLDYLTHWRMQKACLLLRTTRAAMKEVAVQVGYESPSAFSKAFARRIGAPPCEYRRAGAAPPPAAPLPPL